jgi:hypothetical protein|nr:MAG TPA: hypothetical protein [Caudoviricetes sp.]
MKNFTYKMANGEVLSGTVDVEINYTGWNEINYACVVLDSTPKNGVITRVKFTRDLVEHLGGQGQKSVSEEFYIEKIRDGIVIDRELVDVSGGRPHVVDLDAAGGYGKAIKAALQEG